VANWRREESKYSNHNANLSVREKAEREFVSSASAPWTAVSVIEEGELDMINLMRSLMG
jgi:hypothetical protein